MNTIRIKVNPDDVELAMDRHAEGKKRYSHLPNTRVMGPHIWAGALGEIIFQRFLTVNNVDHTWAPVKKQRTEPDFLVGKLQLETKTQNAHYYLKDTYDLRVNLTQYQRNDNTDEYFWMNFNHDTGYMELVGFMSKRLFGIQSETILEGSTRNGRTVPYSHRIVPAGTVGDPAGWLAYEQQLQLERVA